TVLAAHPLLAASEMSPEPRYNSCSDCGVIFNTERIASLIIAPPMPNTCPVVAANGRPTANRTARCRSASSSTLKYSAKASCFANLLDVAAARSFTVANSCNVPAINVILGCQPQQLDRSFLRLPQNSDTRVECRHGFACRDAETSLADAG